MEASRCLGRATGQTGSVGARDELGRVRIARTNQRRNDGPPVGCPPYLTAIARTRSLHPGVDLQLQSGLFEEAQDHMHPATPIPVRSGLVGREIIDLAGGKAGEGIMVTM